MGDIQVHPRERSLSLGNLTLQVYAKGKRTCLLWCPGSSQAHVPQDMGVWLPFRLCPDTSLALRTSSGSQGHKRRSNELCSRPRLPFLCKEGALQFYLLREGFSGVSFIVFYLLLSTLLHMKLMSLLLLLECVCFTKFQTQKSSKKPTKNCHRFLTQTFTFYHICFIFLSFMYFFFFSDLFESWQNDAFLLLSISQGVSL